MISIVLARHFRQSASTGKQEVDAPVSRRPGFSGPRYRRSRVLARIRGQGAAVNTETQGMHPARALSEARESAGASGLGLGR